MIERHSIVEVDCDDCGKIEKFYVDAGTPMLPEDWIQVNEGPPFYKNFDFCSAACFTKWHKKDKTTRIKKVYEKQQKKDEEQQARREQAGKAGPHARKIKDVVFEET